MQGTKRGKTGVLAGGMPGREFFERLGKLTGPGFDSNAMGSVTGRVSPARHSTPWGALPGDMNSVLARFEN